MGSGFLSHIAKLPQKSRSSTRCVPGRQLSVRVSASVRVGVVQQAHASLAAFLPDSSKSPPVPEGEP